MPDVMRPNDPFPEWARRYFEHVEDVKKAIPDGWHVYGEKKDEQTPRYMIWRKVGESYYCREWAALDA